MTYKEQLKAEAREKGYCSRCLNKYKHPLPGKTICQACGGMIRDFEARTLKARGRLIKPKRNSTGRLYDKIIDALGSACAGCGQSDVRKLNIDHELGGGSRERTEYGKYLYPYYKNVFSNIGLYQLLCANCNSLKAYGERRSRQ